MGNLVEIGTVGVVGTGVVILATLIFLTKLYRRASKEIAFVRTGVGGEKVVMNGGALVFPIFHETMPVNMNTLVLSVVRRDGEALITLDRLRIDVKAEFYVRVKPDSEAIAMAAQTLGHRTMQPDMLKDLVEGKFVDALRSVAAGMTMNELHEQRADFVQKVQQVSSNDLAMNGLELESVSLTGLDQTSIEHFNANNAFDAEGLTKLTEQIEARKKLRNDIEQDTRVQMETKNLEADTKSFEIGRDKEYARLAQEREVEVRRASQMSEIAKEQALRNQEAESARIEADRLVEEARIDQVRALEIARQEQQIAVQNKSREESQAKAEADDARAKAVEAEERVATARESEIAERQKKIELIEAAKQAERDAIKIRVDAEADKDAATNRAEAARREAEGEADATRFRAEADRVKFEVEAEGQRAVNEAANILSMDQISLQTKLALLKVLPEVIRESAKPMEAIDSIKIVQVDGLTQKAGAPGSTAGGGAGGGSGNLANDAVAAALAYRAQAPVLDGLMKELGLDGSSLGKIVEGATNGNADGLTDLTPEVTDADELPSLFNPGSDEGDSGEDAEVAE
ncbi:flotillin family protein [Aurantiacibacter sp. D1-12]|uniref:flotillin family protein n=1 Tax=Aurantiacibacter sp. D1-12 TaxID=2993658 RepID=UPI00237CC882|nr:flotillin domain-containing protein [Aurantiacibacter sp. D1-12]MDE1468432.1 SPFH domain-containing protein [Aurantiacibacter sp. D1-12]